MNAMAHIHAPNGYYIGQVRPYGFRSWKTVTEKCTSAELAMSKAALKMRDMYRARVLFIDNEGWYAPVQVMEAKR
jgi:hypothetical protein